VRVSRCWCGRRVGLSAGLVQRRGACGLYSVGMTITEGMQDAILKVPADVWTPAYDADEQVRDGAWVADITGLLDLSSWPAGMRVIVRKERPHPGAQLRSPTSTGTGSPRSPPTPGKASSRTWNCGTAAGSAARTGSAAPRTPGCGTCHLKGFAHNQLWCEIVALACELLACTQLLALAGRPAGGSPGACGCACSPSRGAWSAAAAACGSASPHAGAGPARSPPRSSACRPSLPDARTHYPAMAGSCQA
jgi:hypothetical protein